MQVRDSGSIANRSGRRRGNKLYFFIHGWIGVHLGVFLAFVLLTGTLATIGEELDWLTNPAMRVDVAETSVSHGTMLEAVRKEYPDHRIDVIHAPPGPRFAAEFRIARPGVADFFEATRRVHVNPYTGEVTGETGWFNIQTTLRNVHMNLSLPGVGMYIVTGLAFFMLASLVTALLFYRRWWRKFFVFNRNRGVRVLVSDLHRLGGLWSLWFTLLMALTGIWYFVEAAMFDFGAGLEDTPVPAPVIEPPAGAAPVNWSRQSLDQAITLAHGAFPGIRVAEIRLPRDTTRALDLIVHGNAWLVRPRANRVFIDPYRMEIAAVQRAEELPLAHRWIHTADPLHFGDFGGLATKLIWLAFGLVVTALTVTGTYLHFRRMQAIVRPARPTGGACAMGKR